MVKNEVRLFLKISWSRAGCKKNASQNIVSSGSYDFFKSGSQLLYASKLQIAVSQNDVRNIF